MIEDSGKVFIVDFTKKKPEISHTKCGCELVKIVTGKKGDESSFWFLCPKCRFETMQFSQKAWNQVLEKLKNCPSRLKMSVNKYCAVGEITLFSELVMILERILPE